MHRIRGKSRAKNTGRDKIKRRLLVLPADFWEVVIVMAYLEQKILRKIWRACMEFDLVLPGDRILVGLSGGKDSSFLLYALATMQKFAPFKFAVGAVTIDLGFETPMDEKYLKNFCNALNVPFYFKNTNIAQKAFNHKKQNPCPLCAYFRRGAVANIAVAHGYNKIAFAHHLDDAVETFLMSQIYSGQVRTFAPKTPWENNNLEVIRPLVYLREKEIKGAVKKLPVKVLESSCPLNGKTKREEVKQLIRELTGRNRQVFDNLVAAMRDNHPEMWPQPMGKEELREKYRALGFIN